MKILVQLISTNYTVLKIFLLFNMFKLLKIGTQHFLLEVKYVV